MARRTARHAAALLHAWMDAEHGRFALWLPVWLGAGVLLYFAQVTEPARWLAPAAAAAALALTTLGWRSAVPRAAGLALLMLALGVAAGQGAARRALPLAAIPTRAGLVEGTVRGLEILPDGRRITLDAARFGADPPLARTIRLRLRANDPATPRAGDTVRVRALVRAPAPPSFPGARDPQREAFFAGTAGSGMALAPLAILASAPPDGPARWTQSLRDRIATRILAAIPGSRGAIAATMLTGTGSAIPEPDRAAFRDSGLAHLLAVAGLHIGIVMGLVMGATRFALAFWEYAALRWPTRQIAALTALAAGGGYALLTGGHLPILRSFAMASLVTLGLLLGRRAVSLRGLALAATLLLLAQPQEIMGVSFRMSFSAVLALIAGYEAARPWLTRLRVGDGSPGPARRLAAHAVPLAFTSLLAGTASAPYAAAAFGHVQLYFIVANMLAVPLTAMWVMPAGLLGLALMPLHCESLALVPMGWGVGVVLWIGRTVSSWPAATLAVAQVPGSAARVDDVVIGVEDPVAERVAAQVGPDVLDRVQLRAVGRQVQQGDVAGHAQLVAVLVPAGTVEDEHGVGARCHDSADLGQVQVHHRGVGSRQYQGSTETMRRTDRSKQIRPVVALVAWCRGTRASLGPDPGQRALLADAGFVLPPDLQRLAAGVLRQGRVYEAGEAGLKDACAPASCPGWRGRTTSRLKPSRRSTVLMLRSASTTPNLASIARARSARRQRTTPCSARSGPVRTHSATQASCSGERNRFGPNSPCRSVSPARPSSL